MPQGRKANAITLYEDRPRNYDAWELEYSHRRKGWGIGAPTAVTVVENNALRAVVEFRYQFGKSQLVQRMTAYAHTARVDFSTWVDWQERELVMKADISMTSSVNWVSMSSALKLWPFSTSSAIWAKAQLQELAKACLML